MSGEEGVKLNKEASEKKDFSKKMKKGFFQLLIYFGISAFSIVYWELILRLQMGNTITGENLFFLFFVPSEALVMTAINGFFPQKISRFLFPFTLLAVSVYYGIQLVYFRIFGSLFSVSMLGMGKDAVQNFGWALSDPIIHSLGFLLLLLCPFAIVLPLCLIKKLKCDSYPILLHVMTFVLAIILWIAGAEGLRIGGVGRQSAYDAFHSNMSDTDSTASKVGAMTTSIVEAGTYYFKIGKNKKDTELTRVGLMDFELSPNNGNCDEGMTENGSFVKEPQIYEEFDFENLSKNTEDEELGKIYDYFAARTPSNTNSYTGIMKDYNVIYICAEGLWTYGINEKVTPTLYKMSNEGIVLSNYYNSFRNTTVNGEFAFSTGLWPDVSRVADSGVDIGSMPQSSSKYMPIGLGSIFEEEGVSSYAFHNYYGDYYRRRYSWKNLGYENIYFMDEGMTFSTKWPASDYEMMQQSVDKYIDEERFFAYYMTFSGHGPYNSKNCIYRKNIDEVKARLGEDAKSYSSEALGYLAGSLELEYGMEYLVKRLDEKGLLDNTLIVLTGDHYPYYLGEKGRNELAGFEVSETEIYHSTCIMYTEGLKEDIKCDTFCCNVDIVPTILNLLGIKFDSRLIMGTDIFSDGFHKAVLYNKSFLTDKAVYDSQTGRTEWKIDTELYDEKKLKAYVDGVNELIESEYSASVNIINRNVYLKLWKDANLISDEEYIKEEEREKTVKEAMRRLNDKESEDIEEKLLENVPEDALNAFGLFKSDESEEDR